MGIKLVKEHVNLKELLTLSRLDSRLAKRQRACYGLEAFRTSSIEQSLVVRHWEQVAFDWDLKTRSVRPRSLTLLVPAT